MGRRKLINIGQLEFISASLDLTICPKTESGLPHHHARRILHILFVAI